MVLAVTGIQRVDFKSAEDEAHGAKVFGVVKDGLSKQGLSGEMTASVWFADDRYPIPDELYVGSLATIYFEQGSRTPAFVQVAE